MPRAGYAHITLVVDHSGSMGSIQDDAEGGVRAFIKAHQQAPGEATLILRQFDNTHEELYRGNIKQAPLYVLKPEGMTALYDAVGMAIVETGRYLEAMAEDDRPEKVIFVVQTDGEENSSREYGWSKVAEMVKHQTDVYGWEFVFLGAEMKEAAAMGITNTFANHNTGASYAGTYTLASTATVASRGMGAKGMTYGNVTIAADGSVTTGPTTWAAGHGPDDDDGSDPVPA